MNIELIQLCLGQGGSYSCKVQPVRCFDSATKGNDIGKCITNKETSGSDNIYDDYPDEDEAGLNLDDAGELKTHYCQVFPHKRTSTQKSWLPCDMQCFDDNLSKYIDSA